MYTTTLLETIGEEFVEQVASHKFNDVLQTKSYGTPIPLAPQGNTFALNERWRVSDDPLQWKLDRRKPCGTWEVLWFARTRDGLLRGIREKCGVIDPAALAAIGALPEFHRPGVLRGLSVGGTPPSPLDRNGPVAACQGPANAFPTAGVAVVLWPLDGGIYDVTLDGKKIVIGSPNPARDAAAALQQRGFTGPFETLDSQTGRVRMRFSDIAPALTP